MIEEILDLSWWTVFLFALKVISAWLLATIIVVIPIAIVKAITE